MRHAAALVALCALVAALGCGGPDDPEARLRARLEAIEAAVEAREVGDVKDAIAEDFRDAGGRDKRELTRYVAGMLLRHQTIHVVSRVRELAVGGDGTGRVEVIAALASGPIASAADLTQLRGDIYRFEFEFVDRDETWLLQHAQWRPAQPADLFP